MVSRPDKLAGLARLSRILDSSIPIGGSGTRIGVDPIIGLIPGVGDALSTLISGYIVFESARLGASAVTLSRMMLNIGIDSLVGSVPLLGDIFDFGFKANQRNIAILQSAKLSDEPSLTGKRLRLAVALIVGVLVLFAAASIYLFMHLLRAIFAA